MRRHSRSTSKSGAVGLGALLLAAHAFGASNALAGPCCAGGAALPALITDDAAAKLGFMATQSAVIGDVPARGLPVFRESGDDELAQTVRLEGATLVSDRWQVGAAIPFMRRERSFESRSTKDSAFGPGDVGVSVGFEALPEWTYSAWKPRGHVFAQLVLPTGGSIYQVSEEDPWALRARGKGFYTLSAGTSLLKSWGAWDALLVGEIRRPFARRFDELEVGPGWGASVTVGGGLTPFAGVPLRFGLSLAPDYSGEITTRGETDSTTSSQLVWNNSAQLSFLVAGSWATTLSYNDQTLTGPARNTSLNRALSLSVQKRWER